MKKLSYTVLLIVLMFSMFSLNASAHLSDYLDEPIGILCTDIGPFCSDPGGGGGGGSSDYDVGGTYSTAKNLALNLDYKVQYTKDDEFESDNDIDYYKFTNSRSGKFKFSIYATITEYIGPDYVESGWTGSLFLELLDENRQSLGRIDVLGNEKSFTQYIYSDKTYYLRVVNTGTHDDTIYYHMGIKLYDDLNTKENPSDLFNGVIEDYSIDYEGDVDYYQFTAQESGVWGYKVTGILNADISIICNDIDIEYSNSVYTKYGSANYKLTNSSFFVFKEGGHYTIKVKGSNIGTYNVNKYYDIGMKTIELNSKSFSKSVVYSYPGYIDGYQGYDIGYFTTKDKAKLFINSLSTSTNAQWVHYGIGLIAGKVTNPFIGFITESLIFLDNNEKSRFIDYTTQKIDEMDSEGIYIALRLENGSVSNYQMTIGPWNQESYYYSDIFYYDYTTTIDEY